MAVFAVALMLGCGIVPLFSSQNADGGITVAQNDQLVEGMTLSDIVEKIRSIGNAESIDFGDMMLVRVDDSEFEEVTAPTSIDKVVEIEAGKSTTLDGEYEFTNSGYFKIMPGGKLVLFPLDKNNTGFTFVNKNDEKHFNKMIVASSGALISVFGITFKIAYKDDGVLDNMSVPISLGYTSEAAKAEGVYPTAKFDYKYGTTANDFELKLSTNFVSKLMISKMTIDGKLVYPPSVADPDLKIKGNIELNSDSGEVRFTNTSVEVDVRHGGDTLYAKLNVESFNVKCNCSENESEKTITNEGRASFKIGVESLVYSIDNNKVEIKIGDSSNDADYLTCDFNFKIVNKITTILERNIQVSSNKPLDMNFGTVTVSIYESTVVTFTFTATGLALKVDSFDTNVNIVRESGEWKMKDGTANVNVSLSIDYITFEGELELSFLILAFNFMELKDITVSSNLSATLTDGKNWTVKSDKVAVGGKISKILPTKKYGDDPIFGNYVIGIDASITGFETSMLNGVLTHKGNANLTLSTVNNGLVRTFVVTGENVVIVKSSDGGYDVGIGRVYLNNGLPLKTMVKNFKDFKLVDNMEIELEIKNLGYNTSEHIYSADSMWFHYRNFSISDDVYVSLNSKVTYQYDVPANKYVFSCASATGYLKDRNADSEQFTIENGKFAISKFKDNPLTFNFYIYEGKAVFGKGYMPVYLHVMKDADFTANGLSAYKMSFEKGATANGTVSVDTSDGIHYSPGPYVNIREIYYDYVYGETETCKAIYIDCITSFNADLGCTVYIDISDFSKGRSVANEHCSIDRKPQPTEGITYGEPAEDHKSIDFTLDGGNAHIIYTCFDGDGPYELVIDGTALPFGANYNSKISYHDPNWKDTVVGLKDDAGNFYARSTVTDDVSFIMPARNMHLVSVESTDVEPVVEKGKAVIDARGADIVQIPAENVVADTVEIIVTGADIKMSGTIYNSIVDAVKKSEATNKVIFINVSELKTSDIGSVQKAIEGKTAYDISMKYVIGDKSVDVPYDGGTVFEVTLKVKVSGEISGFKATYVNEYGQTEIAGVKSYKSIGNGEYEVTIVANHFSTYAVEPVTIDQGNAAVIAVLAAAAIAVCAFGVVLVGTRVRARP